MTKKPLLLVALLFALLSAQGIWPVLKHSGIGWAVGALAVYLVYLLLSSTPSNKPGNWSSKDEAGRD